MTICRGAPYFFMIRFRNFSAAALSIVIRNATLGRRRNPIPVVPHKGGSSILTNRRGFRAGRNPRNFGWLARRSVVCEPNSGRSHASARLNSPASSSPQNSVSQTTRWRGRSRGSAPSDDDKEDSRRTERSGMDGGVRLEPEPRRSSMAPHCSDQSIGRSVRRDHEMERPKQRLSAFR